MRAVVCAFSRARETILVFSLFSRLTCSSVVRRSVRTYEQSISRVAGCTVPSAELSSRILYSTGSRRLACRLQILTHVSKFVWTDARDASRARSTPARGAPRTAPTAPARSSEASWRTAAGSSRSTVRVRVRRRADRASVVRAVAFAYTLVPIRPRWRGERRSLRTFAGASLRPHLAFNPRPR